MTGTVGRVRDDRRWLAVALTVFAIAWGGNEFTPLLVMYKNAHGLSAAVVDVLLFAYVLGIVPALLIGGPLSDRYGRAALLRPAPLLAACGSGILAAGADSAALLFTGRVFSGLALGLAMAVGSSWLKELSPAGTGAGRAAMSLTAGFGVGAGVAGGLAQWAPLPDSLSYLINVALCLIAAVALFGIPVTSREPAVTNRARLIDDLAVPAVGHRRFLLVVLPIAPWVFGAAASAYAVLPTLVAPRVGHLQIGFSALVTVVTLGSGFAIQSVARRLDRPGTARTGILALTLLVGGMVLAAVCAQVLDPWLTLATGAVLGAGYGIALVAGLTEVQRIATSDDLAGLNAVFYSVTYLGFAVPATMAVLHGAVGAFSYPAMFGVGAAAAAGCLVLVTTNSRRHVTRTRTAETDAAPAMRG
ncbi:MFS transporter [Williamsia sterculiae]|uniref:Predicted arabinose efflux permease, MFS family n=1 Tax=Williamsia sterculiae TaxID=1344003 RepID=A0A1N7CGG1_9NOCA|nr:MFS transporter [Williamsia sterculiae]SIR62711.1 Predicted arabinose efflux permease, MFS family [Williamsia sterculiae]